MSGWDREDVIERAGKAHDRGELGFGVTLLRKKNTKLQIEI